MLKVTLDGGIHLLYITVTDGWLTDKCFICYGGSISGEPTDRSTDADLLSRSGLTPSHRAHVGWNKVPCL